MTTDQPTNTLTDALALAISDPGSVLPRDHDSGESVARWGARAVESILVARGGNTDNTLEWIAREIEAGVLPSHPNSGYKDGFARAAQIVRGLTRDAAPAPTDNQHDNGLDVCASCGDPAPHTIMRGGDPTPACLRHLNHWRTPPMAHGYGDDSDCVCGRNFETVRGLREHITKARLRAVVDGPTTPTQETA